MRWTQLISYIARSRLAYLTINGICWMWSMRQQRAWNHLSVMNLWCTGSLWLRMHFEVKAIEKKHNSTTFSYTGESSRSVMSLVTTAQVLHIWQSHMAIMPGEVRLSCVVRIWDTASQIHSDVAACAGIWSKFWGAGEYSPYVLSRIMTAPAQHICQSHLALRHSRWYWVLHFEYDTWLAYSWQSRSVCS